MDNFTSKTTAMFENNERDLRLSAKSSSVIGLTNTMEYPSKEKG